MSRMRSRSLLALVGGLSLLACSSTTNNTIANCGSGTVLQDGVCVAGDGGGTADSAASEETGADSSSPSDTSGDTVPKADSPPTDAPDDSPISGDPCPSTSIYVNCSSTCGGPSDNCASAACLDLSAPADVPIVIESLSDLPIVMRTPSNPGNDPTCSKGCPTGKGAAYAMAISFRMDLNANIRIKVDPPWVVRKWDQYHPFCAMYPATACFIYTMSSAADVLITTDDPKAPSRNVVIDNAPAGVTCP